MSASYIWPSGGTKACPVYGCHSRIEWTRLVCHWHWKRLPPEIRAELSRLHNAERGSDREIDAILTALEYLADRQGERPLEGAQA